MKWIGKILAIVILLGLLFFTLHFLYVHLLPKWASICFYTYLATGVLLEAAGLISIRTSLIKSAGFRERLSTSFVEAKNRGEHSVRRRLESAGQMIVFVAAVLYGMLLWPLGLFVGLQDPEARSGRVSRKYLIRMSMRSQEHLLGLFALSMIAAVYAGQFLGVKGHGYGTPFAMAMTLSIVLRHIRYATQPGGLPSSLRKVSGSPYLVFLLVMLTDFLGLTAGFTLFTTHKTAPAITLPDAVSTMRGLYQAQAKDLLQALYGRHLTVMEIAVGSAGLLFYLALLRIALQWKEFKRGDEDYLWLAEQYNALGDFSTALKYNRQINTRTPDAEKLLLTSLIGVNQLEEAYPKAKYLADETGIDPFSVMLETGAVTGAGEAVVVTLFRKTLENNVPDAYLQDSLSVAMQSYPSIPTKLGPLLTPHQANYPLTYARLLIGGGQSSTALEVLKEASVAANLDRIIAAVLRLIAIIALAEQAQKGEEMQAFENWSESDLPMIGTLLSSMTKPLDNVLAFSQLNVVLFLAEAFDQERAQQIKYLVEKMQQQVQSDPKFGTAAKAIDIRLESLRKDNALAQVASK